MDICEAGALDLFSGRYGVAKQMVLFGAPWVLTFEWSRSTTEDLLSKDLRQKILLMFRWHCFKSMGAAPICSSLSIAVAPPVRCAKYPRGIPGLGEGMRKKVSDGNSHSDFVREAVDAAEGDDCVYFVENPDTSWWWRQRRWNCNNFSVLLLSFRNTLEEKHLFCYKHKTGWNEDAMCLQRKAHTAARNAPSQKDPLDFGGSALS